MNLYDLFLRHRSNVNEETTHIGPDGRLTGPLNKQVVGVIGTPGLVSNTVLYFLYDMETKTQ